MKAVATGDGGEGGDYSDSFEDETRNSASLEERAKSNTGKIWTDVDSCLYCHGAKY